MKVVGDHDMVEVRDVYDLEKNRRTAPTFTGPRSHGGRRSALSSAILGIACLTARLNACPIKAFYHTLIKRCADCGQGSAPINPSHDPGRRESRAGIFSKGAFSRGESTAPRRPRGNPRRPCELWPHSGRARFGAYSRLLAKDGEWVGGFGSVTRCIESGYDLLHKDRDFDPSLSTSDCGRCPDAREIRPDHPVQLV